MNVRLAVCCLCLSFLSIATAESGSRVISAGLFKNGIASITRELTLPGPGTHTFKALGAPLHGTLWVDGPAGLVARTAMTEVTEPADAGAEPDQALVGKKVEIGLRLEHAPLLVGTLVGGGGTRYVLESSGQRIYVARDDVAWIQGMEPAVDTVTRTEPALVLEAPEGTPGNTVVRVRYLAQGLTWAPSYRIDLSDPATLAFAQSAVIRNNLEDLVEVPLDLISGFPNIEFAGMISPFAIGTGPGEVPASQYIAGFGGGGGGFGAQVTATSNISPLFSQIGNNAVGVQDGVPPVPYRLDEGADIHYLPAGAHTLKKNEAILIALGSGTAPYTRIVEWRVDRNAGDAPGQGQQDIWDAVRFKNPLNHPITTGPAMVEGNGRFLGSKMIYWSAPGSETVAYITRALSVQGAYKEVEVNRENVKEEISGSVRQRVSIRGTLTVHNNRTEETTMVIRHELSGSVQQADGEPDQSVGSAGPGERNPSTKLNWTVKLAPGEKKELNVDYQMWG